MSNEDDKLSFGQALLVALIIAVIAWVGMFTFGWPLALIGKYAWNEMIATWLPLPTASVWNIFGLMVVSSLFIPAPSKIDGWLAVTYTLISKPLFILGATIVIS